MLFLFVFGIITGVFILKQLFASGSVIIGELSLRRIIVKYRRLLHVIVFTRSITWQFFGTFSDVRPPIEKVDLKVFLKKVNRICLMFFLCQFLSTDCGKQRLKFYSMTRIKLDQ